MGASAGADRGQDVQPYPVLDRATATLTMREHETDPRADPGLGLGPGADRDEGRSGRAHVLERDLPIKGGFKTGGIYEFIHDTEAWPWPGCQPVTDAEWRLVCQMGGLG